MLTHDYIMFCIKKQKLYNILKEKVTQADFFLPFHVPCLPELSSWPTRSKGVAELKEKRKENYSNIIK